MPGEEPTLPISRGKSREINLRDSDKDMGIETLLARLLWTASHVQGQLGALNI
jgi:hypothetical protein